MVAVTLNITRGEYHYVVTFEGVYHPPRPAPPASDPDSGNYSDTGDPPDFDIHKITIEDVYDNNNQLVGADTPGLLTAEEIEPTAEEFKRIFEGADDGLW